MEGDRDGIATANRWLIALSVHVVSTWTLFALWKTIANTVSNRTQRPIALAIVVSWPI